MGSVLIAGADGHEEAGVAFQRGPHLVRNEGLQVQRIAHLVVAGCLAAVAAAEWLHGGAAAWAWASAAAGLAAAALVAARPSPGAAAQWLRGPRAGAGPPLGPPPAPPGRPPLRCLPHSRPVPAR